MRRYDAWQKTTSFNDCTEIHLNSFSVRIRHMLVNYFGIILTIERETIFDV